MFRSDWDVRKTPEPAGMSSPGPELAEVSSRSTDCIDLELQSKCPGEARTSVRSTRERMRKYHGVIKLLDTSNSNSDLSTLDLASMADSRPGMEMVLDMSSTSVSTSGDSSYYTIDSRRLASKHKKSQQDR